MEVHGKVGVKDNRGGMWVKDSKSQMCEVEWREALAGRY